MTTTNGHIAEKLRTAHANDQRPMAPGADLRRANLYGADLREADLRGANLYEADLREADLRGASLYGANLYGADLRGASLYEADLREANLYGADLREASLYEADLYEANLYGAGIVGLGETPSGSVLIFPTCEGWTMQVGCWRGSPEDLRMLIAKGDGWPEAHGAEVARRRPYLAAILTHVDLIVAEKADLIPALAAKWNHMT